MKFELDDELATRIRSNLIGRKIALKAQYKRMNDGRVTRSYRASEIAMSKASISLELEGVEALIAALRTPDCSPNARAEGRTA